MLGNPFDQLRNWTNKKNQHNSQHNHHHNDKKHHNNNSQIHTLQTYLNFMTALSNRHI